jgi:hypothetical protein
MKKMSHEKKEWIREWEWRERGGWWESKNNKDEVCFP